MRLILEVLRYYTCFQVLIKFLPVDQLLPFLHQLMEGLKDPHDFSSSGACVVLNGLLKARGGELVPEVSTCWCEMDSVDVQISC